MTRVLRVVMMLAFGIGVCGRANADVIDFEAFGDGQELSTEIPGVTFENATVLTAGISLNELTFPPFSGTNVIYNSEEPIRISFSSAIESFGAYFTYLLPVTLTAYDISNNVLGTVTSAFSANTLPGGLPNELLEFSSAGISSVTLSTGIAGNFVVDNVTYSTTQSVPEAGSLSLLLLGMATVFAGRRRFTISVLR